MPEGCRREDSECCGKGGRHLWGRSKAQLLLAAPEGDANANVEVQGHLQMALRGMRMPGWGRRRHLPQL